MRGMFVSGMTGDYAGAERLQREAIEILRWGARKWADVPISEKGVVFTPTFIMGAKSMHLETYMQVSFTCCRPCSRGRGLTLLQLGLLQESWPRQTAALT
jgi:hypothetical protein